MSLTPSDLSRIQTIALRHLAEQIGLGLTDADMRIEYETLTIEALSPDIIDGLNDLQSELSERCYLATGITHIDIKFLDELILSFQLNCEALKHSAESMVATLESPVVESPGQINLPIADVQPNVEEELCTIENLIAHISRRTGMEATSIQQTIALLHFKRFKYGGQEFISTKSIDAILSRWAMAIAGDVKMTLHEESTRPDPLPATTAKKTTSATKKATAAKKTPTKTAVKKPVAKKQTEAAE